MSYDGCGTYNTNSQIKFKTLCKSLCDYSDGYMRVEGNIGINATSSNSKRINRQDSQIVHPSLTT